MKQKDEIQAQTMFICIKYTRINRHEMCTLQLRETSVFFVNFTEITTNISLNRFPTNSDRLKLLKKRRKASEMATTCEHTATSGFCKDINTFLW